MVNRPNVRAKAISRASLLTSVGLAALVTATAYATPVSQVPTGFSADTQVQMSLTLKPREGTKRRVAMTDVGDTVTNPTTGLTETVVEVVSTNVVRTDAGNVIILADAVGETFVELTAATGSTSDTIDFEDATIELTWRVTAVTTDGSGNVISLDLERVDDTTIVQTVNRVTNISGQIAGQANSNGANGSGASSGSLTPGVNDINSYSDLSTGDSGSNGSSGGGVRICIPFIGCATIGKDPTDGGDGSTADPLIADVTTANNGDISTVTDELPGIDLTSRGGNGGNGGSSYVSLNLPGADGGDGGDGGDITLTADVNITTTGEEAHGISAQSVGGRGGSGGDGYGVDGSGGTGGRGSEGGTVRVTSHGDILTTGKDAIGIFAQSVGGRAGNAGDAGGIVASGGAAVAGGQGGDVFVTNSGSIETRGENAYGILAQSIGGDGGNAGDGGGVVASGGDGGVGGTGGNVTVETLATSNITTGGLNAHAVFAQSVGGGGGSGGDGSGIVGLGSTGDSGGDSGTVIVINRGSIDTSGERARGIFAQSVGGGGGDGGSGAGLASIGGSGAQASDGGDVTVTNTGDIATTGADSNAIQLQSLGGGGGDGGSSGGALFAVGGSAGGGGDSGLVTVNHSGDITTGGDDSRGIFAQSVGGGGGNGGYATSVSAFFGVAVGGSGGDGGDGGNVDINFSDRTVAGQTFSPLILTSGDRSQGVFAESVGGGGGSGGAAVQVSVGFGLSASVAVGGRGGDGGLGGLVSMDGDVVIVTRGDQSDGILAQSVGGGGGNGGYAVSFSAAVGAPASGAVSVGVGGEGGGGGDGGEVAITSGGAITTFGESSTGLLAQSVGGGGGNGGFSVSVAVASGGGAAGAIGIGVGGTAGDGGIGGTVNADFDGTITTSGNESSGAVIQSVGGGGGNGGYNVGVAVAFSGAASGAAAIGVGGDGGLGGAGGTVSGSVGGDVETSGDRSSGIVVQSVGGGGGNGGFNVSTSVGFGGAAAGAVSVGVGGAGGSGGDGGDVTGSAGGAITTFGDQSSGLVVQSTGGGGGNGGFNVSAGIGVGGAVGGALSIGVGGAGGSGGTSGDVTGSAAGDVTTTGDQSSGVVIQSTGGGGGNGAFNVSGGIGLGGTVGGALQVGVGGAGGGGGDSGDVTGTVNGQVSTTGESSSGVVIQSLGGGGGNGAFNVSAGIGGGGTVGANLAVGVGGAGGDGGSSGNVTGTVTESVTTEGDLASGVVVQSLGGGGGNGGFNVSGGIGIGGQVGGVLNVGVGGSAGGGGDAGEVDASALGVSTIGDQATAFLAQSVGGGGGNGAFAIAAGIGGGGSTAGTVNIGVGGSGGDGGDASRVGATVTGNVTTQGEASSGIVAQSMGGGGGNGAFSIAGGISVAGTTAGNLNVGVGGSGGSGGAAGNVRLDAVGTTMTQGALSDAVLAQSVGGGGGNGAFNISGGIALSGQASGNIGVGVGGSGGDGGDAGSVTAYINENVADPDDTLIAAATVSNTARAITVQSVGGGGGNGGFNITGDLAISSSGAGSIGIGVGGSGGDGGEASDVFGGINGDVVTLGDESSGVLVQSAGGGGGNGAFNITGGISATKGAAGNIMIGVGGAGGDGGAAGSATGFLTGDVSTAGNDSAAVTYQSVGGGGGNGAFNITGAISISTSAGAGNIGVGVGGFGGGGGNAELVDASITGDILTQGDDSHGILLQSLGGGGGNGAFNITGTVALGKAGAGTLGVGIGGFGGGAGNASTVNGVLTGDVTTSGDDSFGAMLQSLGGGGGNGAFNITGSLSASGADNTAVSVGIGIGGFGGGGGNASDVTGVVTGNYTTSGDDAQGVIAQSLGGGGGNGGMNIAGAVALSGGNAGTGSIGIGGFGGSGGNSGDVDLTYIGNVITDGANSDGVVAQSTAGGGGIGALNISGGISGTTNGSAASLGFGLGGFGGNGGDSGDVVASVTGNVWAQGLDSDVTTPEQTIIVNVLGVDVPVEVDAERTRTNGSNGVVAQSLAGGGGLGGMNISGQISITQPGSTTVASRAVAIGIGGFGGSGGDAGTVDLTVGSPDDNRIQVQAVGDDRSAVMAQSVGGGGGSGGMNITGGIAMDGTLNVGIGGFGGDGGRGDDVTADVDADLFASGHRSRGLAAQSLGGGGGMGGINISGGLTANTSTTESTLVFGLGGEGGAGNASGNVTVNHDGQILVDGEDAIGLLAQSVAGGGGSGGLNVTASLSATGGIAGGASRGFGLGIGIGGDGGTGADAGDVYARSTGFILINGEVDPTAGVDDDPYRSVEFTGGATGLLAQSIGGGGGTGGMNITGTFALQGNPVSVAVGGSGASGGHGGRVDVVRGFDGSNVANPNLIRTFGENSTGLLAQSIGGGGGHAGMNFNFSGALGNDANNPVAALITIGGSGAGAGSGDVVTVNHNGNIVTNGDDSIGLHAQSVGGGGGNANFNVGIGLLKDAASLNIAVGGATGAGGSGDDVTVDHTGIIVTEGKGADAILAQSIGGGGGNTGTDFNMSFLAGNSIDIVIGREGGTGGTGGDVEVTADGAIDTTGNEANGIFAQSIGGGGGASSVTSVGGVVGNSSGDQAHQANLAIGIEGGSGATSGTVTITNTADITTRGDEARAIFAQSIGGGGGAGGTTTNVSLQATTSVTMGLGGTGGTGAVSGTVTVDNDTTLITQGDRSDGILAQSIGGGGGMGGMAITTGLQVGGLAPGSTARTIAINVGGDGGTGADGGAVVVDNAGLIMTEGELAYGIRAQSVGGGGGIGGGVLNMRAQGPGDNQALDINVGGAGNTGGSGGTVDVTNTGMIFTVEREAAGIVATSIGGGGGDAGTVINAVGGASGTGNTQQIAINIGGSGGQGGTGGDVTVSNLTTTEAGSGQIVTEGEDAYGIFAQSLGGGGGNGSTVYSVVALQSSSSANGSFIAGFSMGGTGGSGNTGGTVAVTNEGLIDTTGNGAHGILAQSVGGGGGNGGMAIGVNAAIGARATSPILVVGGVGGDGDDGGDVTVNNSGTIVTRGANAHGIVAQSIGGGGGNASLGFGVTGEVNTLLLSNAISALVGASGGGEGGTGGNVTVNHSGDITVLGDGSQAIKAESINGGGGTVELSFDGLVGFDNFPIIGPGSDTTVTVPTVQMVAGSTDTSDMNAGKVTINTTGTFGAAGNNGAATVNQSIGGGGGALNLIATLSPDPEGSDFVPLNVEMRLGSTDGSNNNGADVGSNHDGQIITNGTNTHGVLIQSIGDGGGRGIIDIEAPEGTEIGTVSLEFGSENGIDSAGGDIARSQAGSIGTTGDLSAGTILQTIGGGGGLIAIDLAGFGSTNAGMFANFGALAGSGLNGGDINADFSGGIATLGNDAQGLVVQSIGAGGGELRVNGGGLLDVSFGGVCCATGSGGDINLANTGTIYTEGLRSHGVFIQSIGGGGGAAFGDLNLGTVSVSDGNSGDGGAIRFDQSGNITVMGDNTIGLILQSLGGGGGWADGAYFAGGEGTGGAITFTVDGSIFAPGADSTAVFAQSRGTEGAGNILAEITGLVRGGSGSGVGVAFEGGFDNLLTSFGSVSAISGLAATGTDGNDAISNFGLFVGNLDLGTGENRFNNQQGSTFVAFDFIDLRDPAGSTGLVSGTANLATSVIAGAQADSADLAVAIKPITVDPQPLGRSIPSPQSGEMIVDAAGDPVPVASVDLSVVDAAPLAPVTTGEGPYVATVPTGALAKPGGGALGMGAGAEALSASIASGTAEPLSGALVTGATEPAAVDGDVVEVLGADVRPGAAEPAHSEDSRPAITMTPEPVASPVAVLLPAPMSTQGGVLETFAAPAVPTISGSVATFTNAGTFLMGLSAPRFPIDLLNGDQFGNLDGNGDPSTNLLFGARVINTVDLDGNFVQTETGHLDFDVAFGPYASDVVNVTGDTTVDGTGEVILTWLESDENRVLFATDGTATDNGLEIEDTIAIDFGIEATSEGIELTLVSDFGQDFLNENGRSMGRHLDSAIRADGSAGIGRLGALLGNLRAGEEEIYSAIFTELDPSGHLAPMHAQLDNAQAFADDLFSCESPVRQVEGQCVWTRLEASASTRSETFETFSVEADAFHFRGGFERQMDNPIWTLAAAVGYDNLGSFRIDDTRWRAQGQAFHAGLGFERTSPITGTIVGGGVSTGWQWTDAVRNQNIFGPRMGESEATTGYITTELHIAQVLRSGRVFARPELRGTITHLFHSGLSETGLEGLGVEIYDDLQNIAALSPEIALGAVLHEAQDRAATLTVTFGADFQSTDRLELPMRLLGANPMADPAVIGTALDQESYRISTDLHLVGSDRIGLRFGYTGEFGTHVEDHRAGFDFRVKF